MSNGDQPPIVPDVTTPDLKASAKLGASGWLNSGVAEYIWGVLWSGLVDGVKAILTVAAGAFDDVAAIITSLFTAAQGQDTPGFNTLVAAVLSDTLGVEVNADDLNAAQFQGGRVSAMKRVGADLFQTLANEWVLGQASNDEGSGIAGLPGDAGTRLTPEQGVAAAEAFIGFALSFAVRQGNVAFISSVLPWEWLSGIREYGEMMAKNLGLGRLVRRALQPYVQTLIATPLQEALNRQYRPHTLDAKQIATAYIRGRFDRSDYLNKLAGLGYTDADAEFVIDDTYTRLNAPELLLLNETGALGDSDFQAGMQHLGFNTSDLPLIIQARQLALVQGADREYAKLLALELLEGFLTSDQYTEAVHALRIPKLEADALTRNGIAAAIAHGKKLSLGFLKKAYLNQVIAIDDYLLHAQQLGYDQDARDILEQELLVEQKQQADKVKAKAAKAAAKLTKTPKTPPTTTGG